MQQKAPTAVEIWQEKFSALPRSAALKKARGAYAEACTQAEVAQQALNRHCRRCAGLGRETLDRDALESERQLLAANIRAREAAAAVEAARREAAPAILKHLARHEAESLALLMQALEQVHTIAKTIADVSAESEVECGTGRHPLQKAKRIANEAENALQRLRS